MENSKPQSVFRDVKSRELNGFRVRKRPYIDDKRLESREPGAVAVEHRGEPSPPMALSFCKTNKSSHILSVTYEAGYITLYNTRLKFPPFSTYQENTEKAKISEWVAHHNAIFDLCWIKIKVWDAQEKKCIRALMGHTGSVKSICSHPTNHDLIVSGSRDGSFALWNLRAAKNGSHKFLIRSVATIQEAHVPHCGRRVRRGKAASISITSVLYLRDEVSIATAGAVDRCPRTSHISENGMERGLHGISSLSQDLNGIFISASCMDSTIYLYNILQLEKGPLKAFSGCQIDSCFVKSAISPDAAHILGGSSDGNAYIWQVNKPQKDPVMMKSHDGKVTAVDWCPSETGKVATISDDFTVRLWNIQGSCYSNTRSPSSVRRRVMALPSMERKKLFSDEKSTCIKNNSESCPPDVAYHDKSLDPVTMSEIRTPESQKKRCFSNFDVKGNTEKTPEASITSPSLF